MLEAVRHAIGADTLGYISQQGMIAATEQPPSRLCGACFDGNYPIELPSETALGKNVIEHMLANAARTGASVQADNDSVSALRRPSVRQTGNQGRALRPSSMTAGRFDVDHPITSGIGSRLCSEVDVIGSAAR